MRWQEGHVAREIISKKAQVYKEWMVEVGELNLQIKEINKISLHTDHIK